MRSRASEPEEVPISFDQPPEGSHLPCYNKVLPGSGVRGPSVETWALDQVYPVVVWLPRREEGTLEPWSGLVITGENVPEPGSSLSLPAHLRSRVTVTRKAGFGWRALSLVEGAWELGTEPTCTELCQS